MNWTILNVSIPVYDLQKSKQFYDMLIGYNENQKLLYQSLYKNEESIFFGIKMKKVFFLVIRGLD